MPTSSIPASGGGGLTPRYQKFTSSGTFNLPDGYGAEKPLVITIQVIGGGGAGTGSIGTLAVGSGSVRIARVDYFGDTHATFPQNVGTSVVGTTTTDISTNLNGAGGGSGGIAQTQMSLTGPLTITVGAAGARVTSGNTYTVNLWQNDQWGRGGSNNTSARNFNVTPVTASGSVVMAAGGTGGTSTAGAVSATGGAGGNAGNWGLGTTTIAFPADVGINSANAVGPYNAVPALTNANSGAGVGGQPAGTTGGAVPLLGALAGGSGTTTPVYGSFGISGKKGDLGTHTGVEGTGGGYGSIGASGAVIITYMA
jgi:hypothetical protein